MLINNAFIVYKQVFLDKQKHGTL